MSVLRTANINKIRGDVSHTFILIICLSFWLIIMMIGLSLCLVPSEPNSWSVIDNNMCLFFGPVNYFTPGTYIGHSLFILFNTVGIIVMAVANILLVLTVIKSEKAVSKIAKSATKTGKGSILLKMALRLVLLTLSNVCCWFPILVITLISLTGYPLHDLVVSWEAALIIPVNATSNPVLYLLLISNIFKKKQARKGNVGHFVKDAPKN